MSEVIRVAVIGAAGRMGREVVKLVLQDPELSLQRLSTAPEQARMQEPLLVCQRAGCW